MDLIEQLISVPSPPGDELAMRDFIIGYVQKNMASFKTLPSLVFGDGFQNCLALIFGKPRTAVLAHMDTVAYMTGYGTDLLEMGSPAGEAGSLLSGTDAEGAIACSLATGKNKRPAYEYNRPIERGTQLTYTPSFKETENYIEATYLDNRIGIYNALKLAETLENGMVVFSCWEEHSGGSTGYLARYIFEEYKIQQTLISDITWASAGVRQGNGVAISLRDAGIPRRAYLNQVIALAKQSGIAYQLEVEQHGSSDGGEIQRSPYPIDWCFVGPPSTGMHTAREKIHKSDLEDMLGLYRYLMERL
jgi:putative aminopeptidase FrvX